MVTTNDILSPLELVIARLTGEIDALPPFSDKRKELCAQRSKLSDIQHQLRKTLSQS